ncbi:MAG: site-2 protease family protein [Candidatus Parcubacteria bacterium]|nr:site-2 protease family protein [Candidatus Parcubacteria bacterium]
MFTFISVVLIVLTVFAHEFLGHATAIREAGGHVSKVALGLPYGPCLIFPLKGKWTGTNFVIHYLCPFGAFTEYDEQEVLALPFWQQSRIHASGPAVSIMLGFFLIVLAGFVAIAERPEITFWYFPHLPLLMSSLCAIVFLGLLLRFGGRILFTYIIPFVPIALLFFVAYSLFFSSTGVTSPVAIINTAGKVSELSGAIFFAGNISGICFGFPMLLPLRIFGIALDGEQIIRPLLEKYAPQVLGVFESFGTFAFILLIFSVLQKDLEPIVLPFFAKLFS